MRLIKSQRIAADADEKLKPVWEKFLSLTTARLPGRNLTEFPSKDNPDLAISEEMSKAFKRTIGTLGLDAIPGISDLSETISIQFDVETGFEPELISWKFSEPKDFVVKVRFTSEQLTLHGTAGEILMLSKSPGSQSEIFFVKIDGSFFMIESEARISPGQANY